APGPQGVPGQDGSSGIVQQTTLNLGNSTCPNGGLLIESGLDTDNDGMLSASEITSTGYVCNGDDAGDDQNLTGASLTGTILQIDIENGASALVDLSSLSNDNDWVVGTGAIYNTTENVGIGTTSPNYDLEIAGDVHISGSLIDILGSPGVTGEVLAASPAGNIVWWDATTINTDEQNLSISGASDSLLISGGNGIPLSLIQDGVDDADNDPSNEFNTGFILNGNNLEISDGGGTQSVDLSSFSATGSDDQNLTGASLAGTSLQIDIENGSSATVDLAALQDGVDDADNDPTNEFNTGLALNGSNLEITDGGGTQAVDLSSFSATGTDDQNISGSNLSGTILTIGIENGTGESIDLSSLQDGIDDADNDPANEFNTGISLNGSNLEITDGGGTQSVDLSSFSATGSDDQNLTGASLTGTSLQIDIENGTSATVDLAALQDGVDDADNDPTNEFNTAIALNGSNLEITDGGGTQSVDLSSFSATGSDDQNLTGASLAGTSLQIDIENGTSATVDLAALQDGVDDADNDPTNEYISSASLNGTNLEITDGGGTQTVDLSTLSDDGDWTVGSGSIYNTSDNVGIGTSNPIANLHVNSGRILFSLDNTSFDSYINLNDPSHNLRIQTTGSAYASFNGDRTVGLGIQSTDYVGVGTNTPNSKLELVNSEAVNALDISQSGTSGNGAKIASLDATNTSSSLWIPNASSGIGINLSMNNTASTSPGFQLINSGLGLGIALQNDNDYAGQLINLTSATNDYSALQINHAGTGFGTSVYHTGAGYGHYIDMSNTSNTNPGILAFHAGGTTSALAAVGDFEYYGTVVNDHMGVFAYSNPAAGWGQGAQLQGGWLGAFGIGSSYGIVGDGTGIDGLGTGPGVFAIGDVAATGAKTFLIDHPLDPENKILKHFSIESNEVLNIYRGIVNLNNNGEAEVELDDYFEEININFSYQLTAIGTPTQPYILKEIKRNTFSVAGAPNTKVSWMVIAERNDPYFKKHPEKRETEVLKNKKEKGKYLMPSIYNQPQTKGVFQKKEKTKKLNSKKAFLTSKEE
ncbi:MAG: hypothetical protein CMD01_02620, partial [Flavobacteriales bacterium]|nr:hypothetical protein [Flavobacteriales bacterium]